MDSHVGAGRFPDAFTLAGSVALLFTATQKRVGEREPGRQSLQAVLSPGAHLGTCAPLDSNCRRGGPAGGEFYHREPPRQRVSAGTERGNDVGQHQLSARNLYQRSEAAGGKSSRDPP